MAKHLFTVEVETQGVDDLTARDLAQFLADHLTSCAALDVDVSDFLRDCGVDRNDNGVQFQWTVRAVQHEAVS